MKPVDKSVGKLSAHCGTNAFLPFVGKLSRFDPQAIQRLLQIRF